MAEKQAVLVLVLGDVGRSPRMQYHCVSLADADWTSQVTLVGTQGHACVPALEASAKVRKRLLAEPVTNALPRRFLLLYAPLKLAQQVLQLLWILLTEPTVDVILVQNPPCIPTFAVVLLVRLLRGCRVVVDWHNLGFTILGLSFPRPSGARRHWVVALAEAYERALGARADAHLCVTEALRGWLVHDAGVPAPLVTVQYDRAPDMFRPLSFLEQHDFWQRMGSSVLDADRGEDKGDGKGEGKRSQANSECNVFTEKHGGGARAVADRPALLVSSTSWTADEDFGVLLAALQRLDAHPEAARRGVVCVVTGKGPQRDMYLAKVAKLRLRHVRVRSLWLDPEDYPSMLACADLGICLHTSSSALDLPMKVVDMFGAGLPVCAIDYPCLGELVRNERNGLVFRSEAELAEQLARLLLDDGHEARLAALRDGVRAFADVRWEAHWQERARPRIQALGKARRPVCLWLLLLVLLEAACYAAYQLLL